MYVPDLWEMFTTNIDESSAYFHLCKGSSAILVNFQACSLSPFSYFFSQGDGAQFPLNPHLPEASIRRRYSPQTSEPARPSSPANHNCSQDDQTQDLSRAEAGLEAADSESEVELYAYEENQELMPLTTPTSEN